MNVVVVGNRDEMCEKAFEIMKSVVTENPCAVLGLATGSTPLGLYNKMIEDHKKNGTSYKNVKTANLDEYVGLDSEHEQSYAYYMKSNLFDGLDIDLSNTNIPNGMAQDKDEECARYSRVLSTLTRDIQILGIGSNGHIAFNEPGTSFDSTTHVVDLTESTIKDNARFFDSIHDVPTQAFTMGIGEIMKAKKIVILANGENKAQAVYALVKGSATEAVPASVLQTHSDCTLICDALAAKLID